MLKRGIWQAMLLLSLVSLSSVQACAQSDAREDCADVTSLISGSAIDPGLAKCGTDEGAGNYKPWLPIFRDADETAWIFGVDYYTPQDRLNRDIDMETLRIMRAWHFGGGWEFQFGGALLRAEGTRTTNTSLPALEQSDAVGFTVGPVVRWNFLQLGRVRLFGNIGIGFNYTSNAFPAGGTPWDFFPRGGGGASFRVSKTNWVEASFWWTHLSNDTGALVPGNPGWNGQGVSVSLRHALQVESPEHNGGSFPPFSDADEKAWVSEAEYFWPVVNRNSINADLNVRAYRVARAWHFANGLELQLGGTAFPSPMATALGPLGRWNFLQRERWRVFVDGEANALIDGFFFVSVLSKTQSWNGFFRSGGGFSYRVGKSYWLETAYRWGHTLAGTNAESYSSWSGQGVSISLRHTG